MVGFAKAILISILASAVLVLLMNLSFFFPWYMTLIETTFQLSQIVSNENYINYDDFTEIEDNLKERPIFRERVEDISIEVVLNDNVNKDLIERDYKHSLDEYYEEVSEYNKPYVQRGHLVDITVEASYPFQMTMFGESLTLSDIPISFSMNTMTLRHYKDLDYYDIDDDY